MTVNADVLMKGTHVHGIYDGDPKMNAEAIFYEHLSYQDALAKGSSIIDITAVTHCQEKGIPGEFDSGFVIYTMAFYSLGFHLNPL